MTTTLAVANQKGGVAKTTSVASIGAALAEADLLTRTGREHVIKTSLEMLEDSEVGYDWVLLDCPPSLGVLTVAALTAADGVLVPLQCETLSHRGVGQLLDTVHDVRRFTNRRLEVWGVLPTLYDGRTNHARTVLETISDTYQLDVVEPPIPKTIRFAEAPAAGRSILATSRSSKGAKAYREVADNLVTRAGQPRKPTKTR
jgi:chromosome partitioning protein